MRYFVITAILFVGMAATAQTKKKTQKPKEVTEAPAATRASAEEMERSKRAQQGEQAGNKEPMPLHVVEQMPEPGFDVNAYLHKNINYPDLAFKNNIQGRVIMQFIVEEDGSLSDFTVMQGIGYGCDEEAIRVIKKMPKWTPGKQNGHPTRVYYMLPVTFVLPE